MKLTQISLPVQAGVTRDREGFPVADTELVNEIPARKFSLKRQEAVTARQLGYTADCVFEVIDCVYHGQSVLLDADGAEYEIKRAFQPDDSQFVQLTCSRRQRGNGISGW